MTLNEARIEKYKELIKAGAFKLPGTPDPSPKTVARVEEEFRDRVDEVKVRSVDRDQPE